MDNIFPYVFSSAYSFSSQKVSVLVFRQAQQRCSLLHREDTWTLRKYCWTEERRWMRRVRWVDMLMEEASGWTAALYQQIRHEGSLPLRHKSTQCISLQYYFLRSILMLSPNSIFEYFSTVPTKRFPLFQNAPHRL
jgi:hypothetical protein